LAVGSWQLIVDEILGGIAPVMAIVLGSIVGASYVLLLLSIYPGYLAAVASLALMFSPLWLPVSCVGGFLYLDLFNRVPDITRPPFLRRRWVQYAMVALLLNVALLWGNVPRRLAFALSKSAFRSAVESRVAGAFLEAQLNQRLGLYRVGIVANGHQGGVYFQTRNAREGIIPHRSIAGFAYKPDLKGSPFGQKGYTVSHVVDNWYSFAVSQPCEP
jgi:hypothetical protein